MAKNKNFAVWKDLEGVWRWRLIGTAAAASSFIVKGSADSEDEAIIAAKQSASGAFARMNHQRKLSGKPQFHRPAKKESEAPAAFLF